MKNFVNSGKPYFYGNPEPSSFSKREGATTIPFGSTLEVQWKREVSYKINKKIKYVGRKGVATFAECLDHSLPYPI
jgi:hypothetical protein